MIIEFIAVPGSGKSHFAEKLFDHLKNEMSNIGISIFNRDDINERKRMNLLAVSDNRLLIRLCILSNMVKVIDFHTLGYIINILLAPSHSFKVKRKRVMYLLDILLNYRIIDDIKKECDNKCVFILDEGLLHISSMCMKKCSSSKLKRFFKILKRKRWGKIKQLFVFIDCNTDILFDRLTERTEGWPGNWKRLESDSKHDELEKSHLKYIVKKKFVVKRKKKKRKKQHYIIDNSVYFQNYELFYSKIIKRIRSLGGNQLGINKEDTKALIDNLRSSIKS
ncbi:hypothetical protein [Flavivirga sp. 57AJ16]|uniref:hypothetical protein n=1 Tax=Flavivirga sp. 57AJ16 TaxID=3025307 RepID=UPI002365EF94|nr:hypothetical protein [Flavivirga sp. 57AJ16]MDD7885831.1 hypothetical protein [Flavivirga sp. 57AJ16]